jgi:transcriptional regulator with XRE-family HTH domain
MTTKLTTPRHHLRGWRKHRDMTQGQLAERIGIARSYLSKIESGKRRYDQPLLEAAAQALGCTIGDLISREPDEAEGIDALWASLTDGARKQALAVLRAMYDRT